MGSKLQAIREKQRERVQLRRNVTGSNWRDVKSKRVRDRFYKLNKDVIDTDERLKQEAKSFNEGLGNITSIDEYEQEYNKTKDELKPYLATPNALREAKAQRIEQDKVNVLEEIKKAEQKLQQKKDRYDQKIKNKEEHWSEVANKYRKIGSDYYDKKKERYKQDLRNYEDDYEEDEAYWNGYINKLTWGLKELKGGADYTLNSIKSYASNYASYQERKERYRNEKRSAEVKFKDDINALKNATDYRDYAKKYAKLPDVLKSSFSPPASKDIKGYFKQKSEYEGYAKQGLTPIYKNGKLSGFEDAVLGMSYNVNAYNDKYKGVRNKFDISYNPNANTVSWKSKQNISSNSNIKNIQLSPDQQRSLEQVQFDVNQQRYMKTVNPLHETYNPNAVMSEEELEWWRMQLQKMREQQIRTGEVTPMSKKVGDFIKLDINLPVGLDYRKFHNIYTDLKDLRKNKEKGIEIPKDNSNVGNESITDYYLQDRGEITPKHQYYINKMNELIQRNPNNADIVDWNDSRYDHFYKMHIRDNPMVIYGTTVQPSNSTSETFKVPDEVWNNMDDWETIKKEVREKTESGTRIRTITTFKNKNDGRILGMETVPKLDSPNRSTIYINQFPNAPINKYDEVYNKTLSHELIHTLGYQDEKVSKIANNIWAGKEITKEDEALLKIALGKAGISANYEKDMVINNFKDVASVIKKNNPIVFYNPYETEQRLEAFRGDTQRGQIEAKKKEIQIKYGDRYGDIDPSKIPKDKIDEYNKDVDNYNKLIEQDKNFKWYQGMYDRSKYYGSKGLQLLNPESVGELGAEAGVAVAGYYALPHVAGGIASFETAYPTASLGISGAFTSKNAYDTYKGIKNKDWDKSTKGAFFTALSLVDFVPRAYNYGKNLFVKVGHNQVPAEAYYNDLALNQVRNGEKVSLPKADSVDDIINQFKKTKDGGSYYGVSGKGFKILEKSDDGKQALMFVKGNRIEDDALLWISAKKEGSAYFLRIPNQVDDVKYTLNPFKSNVNPQTYEVAFNQINRMPKALRNEALALYKAGNKKGAYNIVNNWLHQNSGAYVPFRSEIWEAGLKGGTPELQLIVSPNTKVVRNTDGMNWWQKFTGYKDYTNIRGYNIPIRPYQVINTGDVTTDGLNYASEIAKIGARNSKYYDYASNLYTTPYQIGKYSSIYNYYPSAEYSKLTNVPSGTSSVTPYNPDGSIPYYPYGDIPLSNTPYYPYEQPPLPNNPVIFPKVPFVPNYRDEPTKKRKPTESKDEYQVMAWQPIYYDKKGNRMDGPLFPNVVEAQAMGIETVDNTPLEKFTVRQVMTKRELLRRHMGTNASYKFKAKGNVYVEKVPYRKDKGGEGKMNIMQYVFNSQ